MSLEIVVLKFGSSVLASSSDIPSAVHEIYRWYRAGHRVIAVVSALGQVTNGLIRQAADLTPTPEPYALAEFLATGERAAAALLGIALDRAGLPTRVVDPREIHLTALGEPLDSEPTLVGQSKLHELLSVTPVLVVPGFFGHDAAGRLHLLGRGGSDLSAVFLAAATQAKRCRLLKDVDGVYDLDPALAVEEPAHRYGRLDYGTALEKAAPLIQPKAVRFLERFHASAEVAAVGEGYESVVGPQESTLAHVPHQPPTQVLLLGLGTVGLGVYRRLNALSQHFGVLAVHCLDPAKHRADGVPPNLLIGSGASLRSLNPDVLVDVLPGLEPSRGLVRQFLERGVPVVSANKRLVAEAGLELDREANQSGTALRYSAAVGGSAPMIEAVRRQARRGEIRMIEGILNGTCNFVLERCAAGRSLTNAVADAQEQGFAETNPDDDLFGTDAARKLRILARHAFGRELTAIDIRPLNADNLTRAQRDLKFGQLLRVVSRAGVENGRLFGEVSLRALRVDHALAQVSGEWNRLLIEPANGPVLAVTGRGAGRWPTTEAVLADLFELRQAHTAVHADILGAAKGC